MYPTNNEHRKKNKNEKNCLFNIPDFKQANILVTVQLGTVPTDSKITVKYFAGDVMYLMQRKTESEKEHAFRHCHPLAMKEVRVIAQE